MSGSRPHTAWRDWLRAALGAVSRTSGHRSVLYAIVSGGWFTLATELRAQQAASISGTVSDRSGAPVSGAYILVERPGADTRRTQTDDAGRFRLAVETPATMRVHVRRLGFVPKDTSVAVADGVPTTLAIVLEKLEVQLDMVRVFAKACAPFSVAGFECRQARAVRGTLLDVRAIDSLDVRWVAELVEGRPEFRIVPIPVRRAGDPPLAIRSHAGWRCLVEMVDGFPRDPDVHRIPVKPNEVYAVEIYAKHTDVPPELERFKWRRIRGTNAPCALIMYWTSASLRKSAAPTRR